MSEYIFKLPDLGEGTVEAEIGEWEIAVGDVVQEEDVVGSMMTDKAAVEVSSPVAGRVVSLAGEPGDVIAVGAPLVVFETDSGVEPASTAPPAPGAALAPAPRAADESNPAPDPASAASAGAAEVPDAAPEPRPPGARVLTSPAIRHRARQAQVDLNRVPGTGPRGRILRQDLEACIAQGRSGSAAPPQATTPPVSEHTGVEEIKVIGLRRMIAERMSAAKRTIPHFAYVEEIDITELEALRNRLNSREGDGTNNLTLLPFLSMALIRALQDFPQCNAVHDAERNVIIRHKAVHLGVAAQTPDGLKVPVVRHAESLGLRALGDEIRRLAEAARNNTATRSELTGSTITVTSLGRLGGIVSTPVINAPEVAIIGVNKAVDRPVVHNGHITVRRMMNLSSSFDHRFVDGYDAAALIQAIKLMMEHPAMIFIDE